MVKERIPMTCFIMFIIFIVYGFLCEGQVLGSSSTGKGFSAELIHRDSPGSPFHDPTSTPSSRLHAAIRRSASRASSFSPHPRGFWSPITNDNFEYLMTLHIGTNAHRAFALVDTGSSLMWLLCDPCLPCFRHVHHPFDHESSDTYKTLHCQDARCSYLGNKRYCNSKNQCEFTSGYINGHSITGILSTERLYFKSTKTMERLDNIIFGCIHSTDGQFNKNMIGIVGLGDHSLSLVHQINSTFTPKFSYCLPFFNKNSYINFGSAGHISIPRAITTDLFSAKRKYYLNLEAIIVKGAEDMPIIVNPNPSPQQGNIIIDTGDMFNYIDDHAQRRLVEVLVDIIQLSPKINVAPPIPPQDHAPPIRALPKASFIADISDFFDLCFDTSNKKDGVLLPDITFKFASNALFVLKNKNAFLELKEKKLICLTILSKGNDDQLQSFGAFGQLGYLIGYDLHARKLTFVPNYC